MKFAGPTKKMMQALEDEGLNIRWPDPGTVKDTETLAIEGTFYTGCSGQWEKLVMIDLRNEGDLSTKSNVDAAISNQLDEAYENFSVDEELELNMGANGAPSAAELLADMQDQDSRLKRFSEVAEAVSSGKPVPSEGDNRKIEIDGATAENLIAAVEYAMNHGMSEGQCKPLIDELTRKLEG